MRTGLDWTGLDVDISIPPVFGQSDAGLQPIVYYNILNNTNGNNITTDGQQLLEGGLPGLHHPGSLHPSRPHRHLHHRQVSYIHWRMAVIGLKLIVLLAIYYNYEQSMSMTID